MDAWATTSSIDGVEVDVGGTGDGVRVEVGVGVLATVGLGVESPAGVGEDAEATAAIGRGVGLAVSDGGANAVVTM